MRTLLERRQRGQVLPIAAMAMVCVVGGLAMVVDIGIFMVVQRQLQSAADAGALAGAWHQPICTISFGNGCLSTPAGAAATDVALANGNTVRQLCGGRITVPPPLTGSLNNPHRVQVIIVTVECDADFSFGRIFSLPPKHLRASAAAAIGNRNATLPTCTNGGDITDYADPAPCGHLARLVPLNEGGGT